MADWFITGALFCLCAAMIVFGEREWRRNRKPTPSADFVFADAASTIDVNAKCPACGNRSGKIHYSRGIDPAKGGQIVHECLICGYKWGEETIVNLETIRA